MTVYTCISADSHVNVHANVYVERVPAKFKDRAPRVESTPDGDFWVFEGTRKPAIGLGHMAGRKFEEYKGFGQGAKFQEVVAGGWDHKTRLDHMKADGIDAQVLYSGHFGGDAKDPELRYALIRAYHDWMHEEFTGLAPDRWTGAAVLPMWDRDLAIEEINRLAKMGGYGHGIVPAYSPLEDKPYHDAYWDPLWSTFEEVNWPASIHVGGSTKTTLEGNPLPFIASTTIGCAEPFAIFIFGGVLERHPKFRMISAETGFGWWPYFLDRMDTVYKRHRHWTASDLPRKPSDYFFGQIWATFQEDRAGMQLLSIIGMDHVMWADDYPHTDSTYPDSQRFIDEHFQLVPEADRAKAKQLITCENAGKFYGWIT